jgi:Phage integrase family
LYKVVFPPAVLRANNDGAGIASGFGWHGLRHTYASLCVAAGVPIFEVSRFMGHAKLSTTESVYAHLLSEDHSEAMAALGAMAVPTGVRNQRDPAARVSLAHLSDFIAVLNEGTTVL